MKVFKTIKNNKFLSFIVLIYMMLHIINQNMVLKSFINSLYYLKE